MFNFKPVCFTTFDMKLVAYIFVILDDDAAVDSHECRGSGNATHSAAITQALSLFDDNAYVHVKADMRCAICKPSGKDRVAECAQHQILTVPACHLGVA